MVFAKEKIESVCYNQIYEIWNNSSDSFPEFLVSIPREKQLQNEKFLSDCMKHLKKLLNIRKRPIYIKSLWKKRWNKLIHHILFNESIIGISAAFSGETLTDMQQEFYRFFKAATSFDETMSMEEIGQAARNYLVYDIFTQIHNLPPVVTPAIFGYSMLYPYTDNYIDDPQYSADEKNDYNRMIAGHIKGDNVKTRCIHDIKTCELIDDVIHFYENEDQTDIRHGLFYMLDAQKLSLTQTKSALKKDLNEDEIFKISSYKGGISVLIDRFYVSTNMSEADFLFYLCYGFFLQLADDLQDITEDYKLERQTLFTFEKNENRVQIILNKLFHFLQTIMDAYTINNFELKEFIQKNCFYLLLFSTFGSEENFSKDYLSKLEQYLPVSISFVEKLKEELSPFLKDINFGQILDDTKIDTFFR